MGKILDYNQMLETLKRCDQGEVKRAQPIGVTRFGYPLEHYVYGHGEEHVIITAGTHATELIGNCFLLHFMEQLSQGKIHLDKEKYTIHFLPILNPEGTIIVTSAIRKLIPTEMSEVTEQFYCTTYYGNCKMDQELDTHMHLDMFSNVTIDDIDDTHMGLKQHLKRLDDLYHYPKGFMIEWTANGSGIDLNANVESTRYLKETLNGEEVFASGRRKQFCMTYPGPYGCPTLGKEFQLEPENRALYEFYEQISKQHQFIGSIIYHSCGGEVVYLDQLDIKNPWRDMSRSWYQMSKSSAHIYGKEANYKVRPNVSFTTVDTKLKTYFPNTLLVELTPMGGTPLAQFVNSELQLYEKTLSYNTKALLVTVNQMSEIMQSPCQKNVYHL